MEKYSLNNNLPYPYRRLIIRIFDIGVIGIVYIIFGILITKIVEKIMPKFNKEKYKKKGTIKLILEIFLYVWIITITHYTIRKIMKYNLFRFFGGLYGYNNNKTREVHGGVILSLAILSFHIEFIKKLNYLVNDRLQL